MNATRILVVDDEPSIHQLLGRYLTRQGYEVEVAETGSNALKLLNSFQPNLVILDLNLPDISGYQVCQQMQETSGVLVLMLTSRTSPEDKLLGFHQGADDYLTKPFNLPELEARIAALLRRQRAARPPATPALVFKDLTINLETRVVLRGSELVPLTALEFDLLFALARYPGRVLRRSQIIQEVWAFNHDGDERVVDVHIGQIRKKLERDPSQPQFILTVRGVGYKFFAPDSDSSPSGSPALSRV